MVLVFADDYRAKHRLAADFSSDLDSLCQRDYNCSYFGQVINCLDLDAFESSCPGQNCCTMDASVGIGTYGRNAISSKRFLLVELRLDYKNPNNLDYRNMSDKISHSRDILSDSQIHPEYCFIFTSNVAPVARNHFERKRREMGEVSSWLAMSPEEFLDKIEDSGKQPYTPINDPEKISKDFLLSFDKGETAFVAFFDYWFKQSSAYQEKYKLSESKSIIEAILSSLSSFSTIDQTMLGLIQMMKEEANLKLESINRLLSA